MPKYFLVFLGMFSLFFLSLGSPIKTIHGQEEIALNTQRSVVRNYKPNLSQSLPFDSDPKCDLKKTGDANCDGLINEFDLSIWEVELNTADSPKRSDFNNDGSVNFLDYGIWRNSYYPKAPTALSFFVNTISKLFHFSVQAEQSVESSQTFISNSGNSQIRNILPNGTSQQVNFDTQGKALSSSFFDTNGKFLSEVSFLDSGTTVLSTEQNGIQIEIHKTATGAVIEFFRDANGKLLAVKSWPTLSSFENNDPPLAVSIPTSNETLLTVQISPNNTSIIYQTDIQGNVLNQYQSTREGVYLSQNLQYKIQTTADSALGLSSVEIPNNIDGKTTYNFYKSGLYNLVITDKNNNYHIAKPVDANGTSWTITSTINNQTTEITTDNPITKLGLNSPDPNEIIKYINYYKSLPKDSNAINFQDGFGGSNKVLADQISEAEEILKIASAQPPTGLSMTKPNWSFGIKSAFAEDLQVDTVSNQEEENHVNKSNTKNRTGGEQKDKGNSNTGPAVVSAAAAAPKAATTAQVGIGNNTAKTTVAANGTQSNQILDSAGNLIAKSTTDAQRNNTFATNTGLNPGANALYALGTTGSTPGTPVYENTYKSNSSCFLAGTKISTPNGQIEIEKLTPNLPVYSYNAKTKQKEISYFKKLDINFVDQYLIINKEIKTTIYHPFYKVSNNTLVTLRADKLQIGDILQDENNQYISIRSIERVSKKTTVYNLMAVSPNNNFYAEGILVHNYNQADQSGQNGVPESAAPEQNLSIEITSSSDGQAGFSPPADTTGATDPGNNPGNGGNIESVN